VLRKSEGKRENTALAPSRSSGAAMQEATSVQEAEGTPGTVDRTVFHLLLWGVLKSKARPGRNGVRKRDPDWAVRHGSFEDLEREISRSRRFGHSFVLARLPLARSAAEPDWRPERTLALLGSLIRTVDRAWLDGKDVYLLFPESDRAMGRTALARLREPLSQVLSEQELDGITSAVFALDECPTSGALLSALRGRVSGARAEAPGFPEPAGAPSRMTDPEGAGG
jgi:hypothetical protein